MRHLLVTSLWFAVGCLLTAVIADTMQRRAEAAEIDESGFQMVRVSHNAPQIAALSREGSGGNEALRPKLR